MRESRRAALVVLVASFVAGVAGLVAIAALDDRRLAFTLGVRPVQVAAVLDSGKTACQGPIDVPADAGSVVIPVSTSGRPGPPLLVTVKDARGVVGEATVRPEYAGAATVRAAPDGIVAGRRVAVCVRNQGRTPVALHGGAPQASRTSALRLDGRDARTDLTLVFERSEERSMLSALGDGLDRASLFRPSWVSAGLLWALAALLVTALPAALVLALRAALDASSGRDE